MSQRHPEVQLSLSPEAQTVPIHIGCGLARDLSSLVDWDSYSTVLRVTDRNVHSHALALPLPRCDGEVVLEPGDGAKNLSAVSEITAALHRLGADRDALVVNIGGGVVGDIGGFAASIYLRGVSFLQVPTTLLSQVDASVGGKTGVNAFGEKNRLGSFAHPEAIIIDPELLSTLASREYRAGFAEILKHGLIRDAAHFREISRELGDAIDPTRLLPIIQRSVEIKAAIVAEDPLEAGARRLLNLGHTIGHAVEAVALLSDEPLLHGEAVAIGLVASAHLSGLVLGLPMNSLQEVEERVAAVGLPTHLPHSIDTARLLAMVARDKKARRGSVQWTLLESIGQGVAGVEISRDLVDEVVGRLEGQS